MTRPLIAACLALLLGGCGSIADIATEQRIYGGVQKDVELMENPFPMILLAVLDVPLSACLDTVLLPVTIAISVFSEENSR